MQRTRVDAVEGMIAFDGEGRPRLVGGRVPGTDSYFFPRHLGGADPRVGPVELEEVLLSRRGRVWSYTTSNYRPPPPFVAAAEPYEPITIAAVELEAEQMVVLGQCADGVGPDDLHVGMEMELVVDTLYRDDDREYVVWKWRPAEAAGAAATAAETGATEAEAAATAAETGATEAAGAAATAATIGGED